MSFFKRALTSIIRTPIKSLVLFLLIFILGTAVSGAISVRSAIHTTDLNLRRNMRPVATVSFDWDRYFQIEREGGEWASFDPLLPETLHEIGSLPYVEYFNYPLWGQLESFELELWTPITRGGVDPLFGSVSSDFGQLFDVQGTSQPEFVELHQGFVEMVDGRTFTEDELANGSSVVVLSRLFAEQNDLSVGDVVAFENLVLDIDSDPIERWAYEVYELEIVGLFDLIGINEVDFYEMAFDSSVFRWDFSEARAVNVLNQIYLPNAVIQEMDQFSRYHQARLTESQGWEVDWDIEGASLPINPVFVLSDPLDLESFRSEAQLLLPELWLLEDTSNRFDPISGTMTMMRDMADGILFVAVAAALLVLGLLITLFLHDRRHEVGIYLALGERKGRVVGQVLTEVAVVSTIAITASLFVGTILANQLSHELLQDEIASITIPRRGFLGDLETSTLEWMGHAPPMSGEEMLAFYDASLSGVTIVMFYAISLAIITLSTIVPIIYLTRINPKKVLM